MHSTSQLPRHDTFQSDDNYTVSFYVRNLSPTDVSVSFRERSVRRPSPFTRSRQAMLSARPRARSTAEAVM